MKKGLFFLIALLLYNISANADLLDYFDFFGKYKDSASPASNIPLSFTRITEKKEHLEHLKNQLQVFKKAEREFFAESQKELDGINAHIAAIKNKSKNEAAEESDLTNKKISLLSEAYQAVYNIRFIRKQITLIDEQHIKILEEYLKDPEFTSIASEKHAIIAFDDLRNVMQRVWDQENKIKHLTEQKNEAIIDKDTTSRKLELAKKEYNEKKREQEDFSTKSIAPLSSNGAFDIKDQGKLLDLEENFYRYDKQLVELKVEEINHKLSFLETNIAIEADKLKILRIKFIKDRNSLRIEESDIQNAEELLEKHKQESTTLRDNYIRQRLLLDAEREKNTKALDDLRKQYNISATDMRDIAEGVTKAPSVEFYIALCEISFKTAYIAFNQAEIDYINAQISLEVAQLVAQETEIKILTDWHTFTKRTLKSNEQITKKISRYKLLHEQAQMEVASFKEKKNAIANIISALNKDLVSVKNIAKNLPLEKDNLFKKYPTRYAQCLSKLAEGEKIITDHIQKENQLSEIYAKLIVTQEATSKDIVSIIAELEAKSIWQRSEYAISWDGVKNIGPDFINFVYDLKYLTSQFFSGNSAKHISSSLNSLVTNVKYLLIFFLRIIALLFLGIFLHALFSLLSKKFLNIKSDHPTIYVLSFIIAAIASFIQHYFISIYLWLTGFALVYFEVINDLFLEIAFYIMSIVYLIYLAYAFTCYFIKFNKIHNYAIFNESFQKRFSFIILTFSILTIFILCFREAFLLATYQKSELPTILLAIYSIIIRTLIIFSIGKSEILHFIPAKGAFWQFIAEYIEKYYYPLLILIITVMIMSDPYVGGYGNLVSYFLWGSVGTLVLIKLLLLAQSYGRSAAYRIFFYTDEEITRERFAYAKTWYGLLAIFLFIIILLIGIFIGVKLWGKSITYDQIIAFFDGPLFNTGIDVQTGKVEYLTPLRIMKIMGIIFAGFLLAAAVNRFILLRIFELLPVDLGIQNTVISITRYLIIFAAIFLAFQWGGLGWLLIALGVVIGSIGYIVKEPITDFVSYFILLVQRPIKIGDYIEINQETSGVVRQITPRSVILRKKDSYSIIVPNAVLIMHPILNWNYSRNFVGLDDIVFTVPYGTDLSTIKMIIAGVFEANSNVLRSPRPIIRLDRFAENGYEFMIRGFLSNTNTLAKWDIASDIRFSLVLALAEHNIKIAVPTRLVLRETE